jgi:hypothetical protein
MSVRATNFPGTTEEDLPLVVDVDGTLVATDLLQEAALQFVARYPLQIYRLSGLPMARTTSKLSWPLALIRESKRYHCVRRCWR